MTPAQFQKLFEQKLNTIKEYARKDLPRHIGKLAQEHYEANFRLGGYVDDKLKPWQPAKRIGQGKGAASAYGTLLSSHPNLSKSISFTASDSRVVIHTSALVKYARIHNEGGQIPVTPKMRKYAWAKYYEANPEGKGESGANWKGLALTKKTVLIIPKRQYMGKSIELNRQIQARIHRDIINIITHP